MTALNKEIFRQKILDKSNLLPTLVWSAIGFGVIGTVTGILSLFVLIVLAAKDVPSLVQLDNGQTVLVEPIDSQDRTDEVITSFVEEAISQIFTWNVVSKDQQTRRITDPGIPIGTGQKVPTRTWQASFAIAEDFREVFLEEMANSFIPRGVLTGDVQSTLLIDYLSQPRELKSGVWEVDMVAFLVIFDGRNPQGKTTSFNKTIVVRAVEPAIDPLPDETTAIQKAVYQTRSKGLTIDEIYELEAK
ncbi:hypothetical protein [cf. Phormidesmis sp. LEGE 11477]|uniref:hypothetical protein n=1 Tax=cf. Phormidesmis sp. LEGE 11477 TaxID=1828680 RepID=UPI0018804CCF|nr:hypothetical protein [cf. Phormidesmis sp. LEGE 11477]MBE9062243.1 hypothetical protein [cf. Phormidesmis sp. LEGE 11477]